MAKSVEKIRAILLRKQGFSIRKITEIVGVSKSSISIWCREIELTETQMQRLIRQQYSGGLLGRIKGSKTNKERRLNQIEYFKQEGRNYFDKLTKREFLLLGLGLYWGEGEKSYQQVGFCNSDPFIIKLMIQWFSINFGVPLNQLTFRTNINELHQFNIENIQAFWYNITCASPEQFRKPSFKKVKNKKIYLNPQGHYGTLSFRVRKSSALQRKILGLIEGLKDRPISD